MTSGGGVGGFGSSRADVDDVGEEEEADRASVQLRFRAWTSQMCSSSAASPARPPWRLLDDDDLLWLSWVGLSGRRSERRGEGGGGEEKEGG